MFRRVVAGLILGPALLIGSFAWSGYLALHTVLDEDRSEIIARELLDNEKVRNQLAENLGVAIERALPAGVPVTAEQVDAAAIAVLEEEDVTNLIIDAFGSTHRAFLGQGDAPQDVDLTPLADVAREQIARVSPGAADAIPADADWTVELPTERIPDSSPVKSFLETAVPPFAGISIVMVLLAFLTTSDRPSVLRRAAIWAIGTTAVYLIVGLGVPAALRAFAPAQAEVFAALLTALLRSAFVPSLVLGGVGAALLVASWLWPDGRGGSDQPRRQVSAPNPTHTSADAQGSLRSDSTWPAAEPPPEPQAEPEPDQPCAWTPPVDSFERSAPGEPPPTTHVPPVRPQRSAPPQQPVTPPSTPIVPAPTPPSTPAFDPFAPSEPIVTGGDAPRVPLSEPPPFRPTLPTRASPAESVSLPAWTGDLTPTPGSDGLSRPPRWVDGHGWVLDADDERPIPDNARYVEGVGYVVPGPPPRQ